MEVQETAVDPPLPQTQPLNLCVKEVISKERVVEANDTTDTPCLPQSQALNLCLNETSLNERTLHQSQPLDLSTCRGADNAALITAPAQQCTGEVSTLPLLTPTSLNQFIPPIDMSVFYEPISSPVSIKFV